MINHANILCFGAWVVGKLVAFDIVDAYLGAEIGGGMSEDRRKIQDAGFGRIQDVEEANFK